MLSHDTAEFVRLGVVIQILDRVSGQAQFKIDQEGTYKWLLKSSGMFKPYSYFMKEQGKEVPITI